MTYGQKIAQLRKNENMTQSELGKKLNVSAQAISKWENDLSEPDLSTVKKMAEIFNVSIDGFLNHSTDKKDGFVAADLAPQQNPTYYDSRRQLLGVCTECGTTVYEDNIGERYPTVCAECVAKRKASSTSIVLREKASAVKSLRRSIIIGGLLLLVAIIIGIYTTATKTSLSSGARAANFFEYLAVGVVLFAFVGCMYFSDSMQELMVWFLTRTVKWPGIIFEFSLDGFSFLFAMKILFAVLGFLIGVFFAVAGFVIVSILSLFFYPFSLIRTIKEIRDYDKSIEKINE